MKPWFYFLGRSVARMLLFLFSRYQIKGKENIPGHGPLLVVANHLHLIDPPLIGASLPRMVIFMAKEELFRSRISAFLIRCFGAFPVRRGELDREALRQAESALADGHALVMFPEATRSKNAQLQPAFRGSALIAQRSSAPILPIGITGTEKIKGMGWILRRPTITVNIGTQFYLPPTNGQSAKIRSAELTTFIMGRIAELLPVEYRGVYIKSGKSDVIKD